MVEIDQWKLLKAAHGEYFKKVSPHYDEVVLEVAERIAQVGSIGKTDIGALLLWKRLRADTKWVRGLMDLSDKEVRTVTEGAVAAVKDKAISTPEAAGKGRGVLSKLPGFVSGDALASALLYAAVPDRMAVYDRRAQAGLDQLGLKVSSAPGRYRRYMATVGELVELAQRNGADWKARDIDIALYVLGN